MLTIMPLQIFNFFCMKKISAIITPALGAALILAGCSSETVVNVNTKGANTQVSASQQTSEAPQTQQANEPSTLTITNIPLNEDGEEVQVPDGTPLQTMQFTLDSNGKAKPVKK